MTVNDTVQLGRAERLLLAEMPLHAITSMYGEAGLRERLLGEIARLPAADRARTEAALGLASRLHADDWRQRGLTSRTRCAAGGPSGTSDRHRTRHRLGIQPPDPASAVNARSPRAPACRLRHRPEAATRLDHPPADHVDIATGNTTHNVSKHRQPPSRLNIRHPESARRGKRPESYRLSK